MGAVKGRLFNVLAAVSLGLCVATSAQWERSYSIVDRVLWIRNFTTYRFDLNEESWQLNSENGRLYLVHEVGIGSSEQLKNGFHLFHSTIKGFFTNWGITSKNGEFEYKLDPWAGSSGESALMEVVVVPFWLPVSLLSLAPAICFAICFSRLVTRVRDRARSLRGVCRNCGYDLRATPERCPECGTAVGPVA
jgi:hypothetical protein